MGTLVRALDWSATPLGPAESWPQSLRTAVSILLASGYPMYIAWGPEYVQFYNDAYRPILGSTKHPQALGASTRMTFAEIWNIIGPMFARVMDAGEATSLSDFMLPLERHGYTEECYFDFSYSAVRDESGGIGGVYVTCSETTARVLGQRRLGTLHSLSAAAEGAEDADAACRRAASAMAGNPHDIPFALIYLADSASDGLRLAAVTGLEPGSPPAPHTVDLNRGAPAPWPFEDVLNGAGPIVLGDLTTRFDQLPVQVWPEPANEALILPLRRRAAAGSKALGVMVAGASPRRALDAEYRGFLELVADQVAGAVSTVRAYEEAIRRADALAELDRAKTVFFSNVSHEFRTPLTLSLGPLEELLARLGETAQTEQPGVWADARRHLQMVHRNNLRLLKLVNSLLDFSRLEAGHVEAVYRPTDLAVLTAELAGSFRAAAEQAGLRLEVDCPPLRQPAFVDQEMWEKVVLNLLSNAVKFTFEGEIRVRLREEGGAAVLTVADTGTGIAAAEMPRLFERFHRVRGARSRTHEGSGIGLALVHELVRLHGGEVTAESTEGRGTTFTVRVPLGSQHLPRERLQEGRIPVGTSVASPYVEEALRWLPGGRLDAAETWLSEDLDPGSLAPAAPDGGRILVADDNADLRDYLRRLLAPHWSVTTASDGEAALESALQNPPDLVLTDVMMPGLDGFQLLQRLRSDQRTAAVPVVMLSARAGGEAAVEGLQRGADDYVVKPFSARELLARVRANLELARLRRSATVRDLESAALRAEAERVRELERVKSEFLKLASHELRGPIAILRGYLDLTITGNLGEVSPQLAEALPILVGRVDQMASLVEQILDAARVQDHKLMLRLEPVDLREVAEECVAAAAPLSGAGHTIALRLPTQAVSVVGDRSRLATIVGNLLDNAIKYSPDGGQVRVEVSVEGPVALVRVSDPGLGIAEDDLETVFTKFGRVVTSENSHIQGTGLGLYLSREMARMHGGDIELSSQPGVGTDAELQLPLAEPPGQP